MDFRLPWARLALSAALLVSTAVSRDARAQEAAPEGDDDGDATPIPVGPPMLDEPMIGVGLRLRNVRMPRSVLELFVDHAPGGSSELGFGVEVFRRKGDFEFSFGLEYEKIFVEKGVWVEKGKEPPENEVDYVEFDDFAWITAEVTFLNHTRFGRYFALRYGGGAGIGLLLGDVRRTDYRCDTSSVEDCFPYNGAENDRNPYDLPPVFPVLIGVLGGQFRPTEKLVINIEAGIRTLPFFGTTVGYYF
jgi:hypothetical protein